jgi:CheY-like chemotaxis protein
MAIMVDLLGAKPLQEKHSMKFNPLRNHRILVIDDDPEAHQDILKILTNSTPPNDLEEQEAALFGYAPIRIRPIFEIDSAYQGEEGLEMIEKSLRENRPYALAFVDVRMPPGWDGVQTACKIWEKHPTLEVVICTAFSDFSWEEIVVNLGHLDRLVILKKPFDVIEVLQLAVGMTEKWRLNQQNVLRVDNLEKMVQHV